MRYMGGKSLHAAAIVGAIRRHLGVDPPGVWVEAFLGGGSVAAQAARYFAALHLSDIHPDLILLWQAAARGWDPPSAVSVEEWRRLRSAPPSPLRGFAGFGCSFGGRWFEGYARSSGVRADPKAGGVCTTEQIAERASRAVRSRGRSLRSARVFCADYRDALSTVGCMPRAVVYLDPPYAGTKSYSGCEPFNSSEFWEVAEEMSVHHPVYVSEQTAPAGWVPIWEKLRKSHIHRRGNAPAVAERLFTRWQGDTAKW